jgi:hypothetical protein
MKKDVKKKLTFSLKQEDSWEKNIFKVMNQDIIYII